MTKNLLLVIPSGTFRGTPWRDFTFFTRSLEAAHDTISGYVAQGLIVQELKMRQRGQWHFYPADLFNGQSLEERTRPLQKEWKNILASVSQPSLIRLQRYACLRRRVQFYQRQIVRTLQQIYVLRKALRQPILFPDPQQDHRINLIQERLLSQQALLSHLQYCRQRAVDGLKALEP